MHIYLGWHTHRIWFRVCGRVNGAFISDWDNIVSHCPDIAFSSRSAWGSCCIPNPPLQGVSPNLAGWIIQAERFNRQALGDLAEGQGNTTQPAVPGPYALGVFMLLCLCNSLSSWIEMRPAGVRCSSSWHKWRGMQWMQALGLAAEQRVFRELMLQQWERDYKVLGLYCRLNS